MKYMGYCEKYMGYYGVLGIMKYMGYYEVHVLSSTCTSTLDYSIVWSYLLQSI